MKQTTVPKTIEESIEEIIFEAYIRTSACSKLGTLDPEKDVPIITAKIIALLSSIQAQEK